MEISLDINITTLVIQMAATVLLFITVSIFFAKPMKNFLEKRREFLAEEFTKAQHANDEAAMLKEQVDLELKKIQEESGQMLQDANAKARVKYDAILADAKADATLEMEKARQKIDKERREMYYDAKKEIAQVANHVTSKLVRKEIDTGVHDDLFDDFVQLIGGASNE